MVWNCQNADCSLRNEFIVSFVIIFGTLSFPIHSKLRSYLLDTACICLPLAVYSLHAVNRIYVTVGCPSVRLSVCPIYRPLCAAAAGLLLWARSARGIDRLLHGRRSAANASSVTLSADAGSWTQTCYIKQLTDVAWCKYVTWYNYATRNSYMSHKLQYCAIN